MGENPQIKKIMIIIQNIYNLDYYAQFLPKTKKLSANNQTKKEK